MGGESGGKRAWWPFPKSFAYTSAGRSIRRTPSGEAGVAVAGHPRTSAVAPDMLGSGADAPVALMTREAQNLRAEVDAKLPKGERFGFARFCGSKPMESWRRLGYGQLLAHPATPRWT